MQQATQAPTQVEPAQAPVPVEVIVQQILEADAAETQWKARKEYLRKQLIALHQAGQVPSKFPMSGFNWTLTEGRKTWAYPAEIQQMEENLKGHKTIAQITGTATYELGDPYFSKREIKASTSAVKK